MSGLLRRLTRRRPATADENRSPATASSEPVAAPAETPAEPGGQPPVPAEPGRPVEEQPTVVLPATGEQPATTVQPAAPVQPLPAWSVAADQPTAYAAQPAPARDLPAGVDPADLAAAPAASSRRGKLRRRLRYLRHVRELLLRDLGGFTYEIHRTAGGSAQEPQRRLAAAKAKRISALDAEVLALESRLGEPHETLLREPGIGGTCPECGELHASDAHYCSRCGTALDERARAQRATEQPTTGSHAVIEPQPASVLWAGGPRPAPAEEDKPEPPSAVTSQWLATDQPTTFSRAAQPETPAKADEPAPATTPEPAATAEPSATPEPATEPTAAPEPAEPDDDAPPAPATAAARAKPKRAAKPRKPAKRAPRTATPEPAADESAVDAPEPQADEPKPADEPEPNYEANGRRDEDVPPPLSSGDPLAARRDQRS